MSNLSTRSQVLSLYKRILRLSQTWTSASPDPAAVREERDYIRKEAQTLFRRNKNVSDEEDIVEHIREAEARIEMALHYRNPYPRPVNLPPKTYTVREGKHLGKVQDHLKKQARPIYMKSIDETSDVDSK